MSGTMKKLTAAVGIGLAVGFLGAMPLMSRPEPRAVTAIIWWLVLTVVLVSATGLALALAPGWLQKRQRQAQLDEAERMGRVYEALGGERPRKRPVPRPAQGDGSEPTIYVVGGGNGSESQLREDLARWLRIGQ